MQAAKSGFKKMMPSDGFMCNQKNVFYMLLVASIVLLSFGGYGIAVHTQYDCDSGIFIDDEKHFNRTNDLNTLGVCLSKHGNDKTAVNKCLNDKLKAGGRCMEGGLLTYAIISIIIGLPMFLLAMFGIFSVKC